MLLEEAIKHCEENVTSSGSCELDAKQLADWLRELMQVRYNLANANVDSVDRLQSDLNKVKGDYRRVALQLKLKTDEQNDRIDSLFHDTEAYKQVIRYQDEQLRNMKRDSLRKTIQIATYAENYYGAMARLQHHNDLATEKNKDYLAISDKWTDVKERIEALLR